MGVFDIFRYELSQGNIDLETDTLKVALLVPAYDPTGTYGTSTLWSDISGSEIAPSAGTYAAGGASLNMAGTNLTNDTTNHRTEFDAPDVVWSAINGATIGSCVIYHSSTGKLMWWLELPQTTTNGGSITITWNAAGIWHFT